MDLSPPIWTTHHDCDWLLRNMIRFCSLFHKGLIESGGWSTSMKITEAWFHSRVQQAASTRLCLALSLFDLTMCGSKLFKLQTESSHWLFKSNLTYIQITAMYSRVQGYLKYSHLTQPNSTCQQQPVLYTRAHCHCVSETNQWTKTITHSTGVQAADVYSVHGMVFGFSEWLKLRFMRMYFKQIWNNFHVHDKWQVNAFSSLSISSKTSESSPRA